MSLRYSVVLFVLVFGLYNEARGTPLNHELQRSVEYIDRNGRIIHGPSWPYFRYSWSLPSFPSFSMGSFFNNLEEGTGRTLSLRKRVEALESTQRDITLVLEQMREVYKSQVSCMDKTPKKENNNIPESPVVLTGESNDPVPITPEKETTENAVESDQASNDPPMSDGKPEKPETTINVESTTQVNQNASAVPEAGTVKPDEVKNDDEKPNEGGSVGTSSVVNDVTTTVAIDNNESSTIAATDASTASPTTEPDTETTV